MNELWFDPNRWAWLPGALFGCLAGAWGACAGILAPRGKAKRFVTGYGLFLVVACAAFLVVGVMALASRQPFGVWFFLVFPGLQGLIVLLPLLPLIGKRYREAEQRKMQAEDFS